MAKANVIHNSGHLKLELITKGVRIDRSALSSSEIMRALEIADQVSTPLELDLILPGDVLVNIAIQECLDKDTRYFLTKEKDDFYIVYGEHKVKVWLVPPPKFYEQTASSGVLLAKIGRTYGNYLLLTPTGGCEFLNKGLACMYCDTESKKAPDKTIDEVLETVEAALKEGVSEYICLNVGYNLSDDGGIARLLPYVKAVKENFEALICVQAQPPKTDEWIDMTYAAGIDSLAYNLEVYDPGLFELIAPGKMELAGRERYFKALGRAAKVFPSGAVVSNLIVGLEPTESTIRGIDILTSLGVVPTLPIFRPVPGANLKSFIELTPEAMAPVYIHLQEALRRNKLSPSWISHFNIVVNAVDAHFFGGQAPLKKHWQSVFKSKRNNRLALNLRRRLRVRAAEESREG